MRKYDNLSAMIKKSEIIICAVAATGLLAYSVAHQVDPILASQALAEVTLAFTISGIKTVAYLGLQTTKSVAVVAGTYLAIKGTALTVSALKNKLAQRLQKPVVLTETADDDEQEDFEDDFESDLEHDFADENDLEEINEVDSENNLESDEEDEDFIPRDKADIAIVVDEEDALTDAENELLLVDQTRVSFYHGKKQVPALKPIKSIYQAGSYSLRPRK